MAIIESIVYAPGSVRLVGSDVCGNIRLFGPHYEHHLNCLNCRIAPCW